ncbi:ABC transporter permease [Pontibacter sp. KCTC 32443]|uniref:ABC transporter permease n=1 Tax=Pontibacter TaxID=323449 RepID=UPI00164D248E|nr:MULTISPECIES: ABC transporter permease [Pontibacter]MBC5775560.1 ABC transporter permease [Pontibacter sp. KCTC 32443]
MLKNYLKMAYRNLMRHKVFSLINISGLALGMTCSILILLWVRDELSFNRFHSDLNNLYRVRVIQHYPGADDLNTDANPGPLAEALKAEMPEVKEAARMNWSSTQLFAYGDKALKLTGRYVDPAFLKMFTFPLQHGSPAQALQQPNTMVITEEKAENLFGSADAALNKIVKVNNQQSYRITGILKDIPENSSLQFDYLMPYQDLANDPMHEWTKLWGAYGIRTFVQLQPGTDVDAFNKKVEPIISKHNKEDDSDVFVQAVADMYLYSDFRAGKVGGGRIENVRLFTIVALFILVIACINFMNLATARSAKRAKEVGVRKAIGANKSSLVKQFMVESVLIAFLALFLALNLAGMLLPQFNELTGKFIELDLTNPVLLAMLLGVALLTGIVSGSYPAFFLSSFNPAVVLKGTVKMNKGVGIFRKGLVVFQFILSGLLIISTLVVYLQLHFIRTKNIGMDRENLVYVPLEGELRNRYEVVKRELMNTPGIVAVSSTDQSPIEVGNSTSINWKGKDPNADILFSTLNVDYDLLKTLDVKLKSGREFSREFGTDTAAYMINEEAARLMQLKEPVGEWLEWERKGTIVGVIRNFHTAPIQLKVQPLVMRLQPQNNNFMLARIAQGKTTEALAKMERVLKKHNPAFPFEYHFIDDDYEQIYKTEAIIGQLTKYFAGIAIFISCLGLFGLALFTAEQRTKEIGIRKVMGASVSSIVFMLSKDFLKLVLVANVIALPLGWYLMNGWLQDYADRTELSWWVFAIACISTFIIAMVTLSFHAIKTAIANPITSLRTE